MCCNSWCCKESDRTECLNLTEGPPKGFRRWLSDKIICLPMQEMSVIPGSGRSPGEGYGNLLQNSCLGNAMGRGAWRATVHGVTKLGMTKHTQGLPNLKGYALPSSTLLNS